MSHEAPERTRGRFLYAVLIVIAATAAGFGLPGLLVAESQTIFCNGTLIANPPQQSNAHLGWSVSADGEWLAAGANQDNANAGLVALYLNPQSGAIPVQPNQEIPGPEVPLNDLHHGDQLGTSVSISGDWLAVGAPGGAGRVQGSGVVYVFHLQDGTWSQQARLDASDATQGAQFGFSVSLNGTTLVVGAPTDSGGGTFAGAAYVFELPSGASGPWSQTAKLLANDFRPFDEFGSAVATDGSEIVVGSPFADDLTVFKNFGAAYVFHKVGGAWTLEDHGKLTAGTFRAGNIQFGAAVAIGGGRIVAGAPGYDNDNPNLTDSGSAYVFERNVSTGLYGPAIPLIPEEPGDSAQFGTSVQIDSNDVLIGAPFDGTGLMRAGAGYLFEQNNGSWNQKFKILNTQGGAFGQSVAALGDQVFMGGFQYLAAAGAMDSGAVAVCPSEVQIQAQPSCTKTGPSSVAAGDLAVYTVVVSNEGEAAATGVILNDPTPVGLKFVSADKPCDKGFPCPLGTIAALGSLPPVKVTFQVSEDCSGPTSITNSATVTGVGVNASTCSAPPMTVLRPPSGPLLSCGKQGPDSAMPGDIVTYDITVNNSGCGSAKNVTLSDPTPTGLTLVSVSGPCTQLPCDLGTIQPGQTLPPVTVKFQVAAGCPAPSSVTNLATVVGSNALEATCPKTTVVSSVAEVGISVSAPAQVAGGDSFSFSVVVTNGGPSTALGVTADVSIANAGIVEGIPPGCTLGSQPGHFTCLLGDLNCGVSKTLIFSVRAPACVTCTAGTPIGVTADAMSQTFDPTLPNEATATISVTCSAVADLVITKGHEPDIPAPGQPMAYVLTVRNNGPGDVPGATVIDSLPNALLGPHCVGGNKLDCTFLGNNLNIAVGPLPVGGEAIYRIEGQLTSQCISTLSNTATVSPPSCIVDPVPYNNTATDTTTVQSTSGVSIQCSGVSDAFEGDFVTFTYVLSNGGPNAQADNPGPEFTDTLPAGLTLVTATASSGTVTTAANTVSWNGSIPVCGTVTIAVQAKVNAGTAGMTLCNQGTVAFDANGDGVNESSANATCCLTVKPCCVVPTLSGTGLAALMILLACVALLRLRRRSL